MAKDTKIPSVVIPITSGFSNMIDLTDYTIVGFWMPAAWTSLAAIVPYESPTEDGTYLPMYDDDPDSGGTAITHAAAASRFIKTDELIYAHSNYVKFKADGQAANRTIILKVVSLQSLQRNRV